MSPGARTPRFAVHVLAHTEPALFGALVASLQHHRIDVYAHIDAKSPQRPFEAAAAGNRVSFVRTRVRVQWGGFSQVRATLAVLRAAGDGYHRHSVISGADVLLRDLDEVVDRWSGGEQLLRIDRPLLTAPSHAWKVQRYHFPDQPVLHRFSGRWRRRGPDGYPLMQGSNWWSLTAPAVAAMLDGLAADPRWTRFHRFALCPDEYVFHSVLAASRFGPQLCGPDAGDVHGQHFIRWPDGADHPAAFTEDDLPAAHASGAVFARKVGADWTWRKDAA